jgi:oxygen-independent coproporphyrinogen III oxidase
MTELDILNQPFEQYVYAYPHKSAYRRFDPPAPLRDIWQHESQNSLFLYVHVPFCTMRCGFCNLFTTANPPESWAESFLDTLVQEAETVRNCLDAPQFSRIALGGGTPTYLSASQLDAIFRLLYVVFGTSPHQVPSGVEVSPDTVTAEKVAVLKQWNIERVSIGIQSFLEDEARNSGRPQTFAEITTALRLLRDAQFPVLNLDLIYGLPGQTVESWRYSLDQALEYRPEEIYLYPLYVRPLTGLDGAKKTYTTDRLTLYRQARERLLTAGYEMVSLRMFRRSDSPTTTGPAYCVQEDGMVGLGCGARSYTRACHYSREYAVRAKSVKAILQDYLSTDAKDFALAHHGFTLTDDEQRRRYLLYSLFSYPGLEVTTYQARFGGLPTEDFPMLNQWRNQGWFDFTETHITPTLSGLELSDALGPRLFSQSVRKLMQDYERH